MKKYLLGSGCVLAALGAEAQVGITYHNSRDHFVGVNYEFQNGLLPEVRLHANSDLDNMDLEVDLKYLILRKEEYQFYVGLGLLTGGSASYDAAVLAPVGLNFYPFNRKNFGFHIEAAPILDGDDWPYMRTSWGLRYRFAKK